MSYRSERSPDGRPSGGLFVGIQHARMVTRQNDVGCPWRASQTRSESAISCARPAVDRARSVLSGGGIVGEASRDKEHRMLAAPYVHPDEGEREAGVLPARQGGGDEDLRHPREEVDCLLTW